ncbi:hypothetical protein Rsub_09450 [Raphidocelis subcapitata]|uniref:Imelysin-like domain-containing protein n=1 Tax=Raphidocelis subcapitata TaxID=307507 RepID=A0A2V0PA23_9CHLO|nr:hypothetical protein Rsub_09450 [Raphidocelis subcapitata]|eukprot:GBF96708.1 hypothetical protein Rsub_09450 [Raphidocelis subcapitata]
MAALAALALAALAAFVPLAAAQADTTGTKLAAAPGYTLGSNVAGYLGVSADVCEYKAALAKATPDFAAAKAIYTQGKNSKKSDGKLRTLQGLARTAGAGEPFWDLYTKHFKTPSFVDALATAALDGVAPYTQPLARREVAAKAVEAGLMTAYMMHEMDEAGYKISELKEFDAKEGAPHNVDEVFALYVGGKTECAPWTLANKRASAFGTCAPGVGSKANAEMVKALAAAQAAAGKGDMKAFTAARSKVQSLLANIFVQATIEYASLMDKNLAAGEPTDEYQGEAYGFFSAIEPLVAQASASSAAAVAKLLKPGTPAAPGTAAAVTAALEKAYAGLGITAADVGVYGTKC